MSQNRKTTGIQWRDFKNAIASDGILIITTDYVLLYILHIHAILFNIVVKEKIYYNYFTCRYEEKCHYTRLFRFQQ